MINEFRCDKCRQIIWLRYLIVLLANKRSETPDFDFELNKVDMHFSDGHILKEFVADCHKDSIYTNPLLSSRGFLFSIASPNPLTGGKGGLTN
jgi:hypothetical protein